MIVEKNQSRAELVELEREFDKLSQDLVAVRIKRKRLKKEVFRSDFNCECDGNYCHTERNNEPISAGETDRFCHDDQDIGTVSVSCVNGDIEIVIYRAPWSTFYEYDRKRLTTGQVWSRQITEISSHVDQTNKVEIIGHADSTYNLNFESWDV